MTKEKTVQEAMLLSGMLFLVEIGTRVRSTIMCSYWLLATSLITLVYCYFFLLPILEFFIFIYLPTYIFLLMYLR